MHTYDTKSKGHIDVSLSNEIKIYSRERMNLQDLLAKDDDFFRGEMSKIEVRKKEANTQKQKEIVYYLDNLISIFPKDINSSYPDFKEKRHRLRPEFFVNYEKELNPDTFTSGKTTNVGHYGYDEGEIIDANKFMKNNYIKNLICRLDKMDTMPLSSEAISDAFHENGVNLRYLGYITEYTKLPHIQDMCLVEMIARSSKKIVGKQIIDLIQNAGEMSIKIDEYQLSKLQEQKEELIKDFDTELKVCIATFLNYLFGNSEAAKEFRRGKLTSQIKRDFNYKIEKVNKIEDLPV